MKQIDSLQVKYHNRLVGTLSLSAEDGHWLVKFRHTYDLTRCTESYNGEHATSVNKSSHPTLTDFIAVGTKNKIPEKRCRELFEEVRGNCGNLLNYKS